MSRVELIRPEDAPLLVRDRFEAGDPGAITASLAQVPELLAATAPFLRAIYGPSAVPMRLKEIVILRVSARMSCQFCVQTHTAVARGAGLSRAEILALRAPDPADLAFAEPREAILVRWSDALAPGPAPVPAELAAALAALLADWEIVELALVAGATLMLNRYCTALELPTSAATLARLAEEDLL